MQMHGIVFISLPRRIDRKGSLTVVGTGIQLGVHLTPEARVALEHADEVLYLLSGSASSAWLQRLRPTARSLHPLYRAGRRRIEIYDERSRKRSSSRGAPRLARVRCVLRPSRGLRLTRRTRPIGRARSGGTIERGCCRAISAEACLFADLGVDPGECGLPEL